MPSKRTAPPEDETRNSFRQTSPSDGGLGLIGTAAKTNTAAPGSVHRRRHRAALDGGDPSIGTSDVACELMCQPVSGFRYMRERDDFPVPTRISANRLAWRLSVIRAYAASRPLRKRKTEA